MPPGSTSLPIASAPVPSAKDASAPATARPLTALPTPSALLDLQRLDRNVAQMQAQADRLGVKLRPHAKTSKSVDVVRRQLAAGARGITVSTLKEAEQFFAAGIDDIVYAVGIAPNRFERALGLIRAGCRLQLLTDDATIAAALGRFGADHGYRFELFIEIDSDGHRAGLAPDAPALVALGRLIDASPGLQLAGVLTHAGESYECRTPEALRAMAEQERERSVAAAQALRSSGLPCPVVSVGATPTACAAERLDGVTEMRPGVYAFFDLVMANVGVCELDQIALSVLATVIGHQREKGWAIVDAGWMAMSRDRGTARQQVDYGYGQVCDPEGRPIEGARLTGANQEHGIVTIAGCPPAMVAERLPAGSLVRILPNHACATGAQHDHYEVVSGATAVATWPRFSGW